MRPCKSCEVTWVSYWSTSNSGCLKAKSRYVFCLLGCWALQTPVTSIKFKFVAGQVEASVVIRAAKIKSVAESRTRVYFAQHVASHLSTLYFVARQVGHKRGNTHSNVFQFARQNEEKYCPYYRTFTKHNAS